ncbi:hypothetical protein P3X46_021027 [Hevea brasiliensis]|uniref:Protein RALF-like 34 n=1 Tax=Hevea brasiliensis TaxID=3981 RepID=A0ABQ9LE64_HEVBR|nr:protein RALF-like 34 [Hevea brasiliensis]KAJ9166249.1 hypothetical protein P3X46_021027 [Hevea brasiliensis]
MALLPLKPILTLSIFCLVAEAQLEQQSFQLPAEPLEWPSSTTMPFYDDEVGGSGSEDEYVERWNTEKRSLYGKAMHYYISYGALSANRIPCPPRSGRSYYTRNCFRSREPVNPYTRGCSCITHCRR